MNNNGQCPLSQCEIEIYLTLTRMKIRCHGITLSTLTGIWTFCIDANLFTTAIIGHTIVYI